MRPVSEGGVYFAGKVWNFRNKANDDLTEIYNMLSDIPRCDCKMEIITLIRKASSALDCFKREVLKPGKAYLLEDATDE